MSLQDGYSLYELLVTIGVASVLVLIGAPPLGDFVARNRLTAEINALHHALLFGRQEAIKRRRDLVLCQSPDARRCERDGRWETGWILFVDSDDDGTLDAAETVLRRHHPVEGIAIRTNRLRYTLRGVRRRNTNGTFLLCDVASRAESRALIVSHTGRPRSAPGSAAPAALACP